MLKQERQQKHELKEELNKELNKERNLRYKEFDRRYNEREKHAEEHAENLLLKAQVEQLSSVLKTNQALQRKNMILQTKVDFLSDRKTGKDKDGYGRIVAGTFHSF